MRMRAIATSFTGILCCATAVTASAAYANPTSINQASNSLSAIQLINGESTTPLISADVLLGVPAYTRQQPTTAKKWVPTSVAPRAVPNYWALSPNRSSAIAQTPIPSFSRTDNTPSLPQIAAQSESEPISPAQAELINTYISNIS